MAGCWHRPWWKTRWQPRAWHDAMNADTPVLVNGQALADGAGLSLAELLLQLGEPADQIATALNGQFIARSQRAHTRLQPGDQVTVFKAIVGG